MQSGESLTDPYVLCVGGRTEDCRPLSVMRALLRQRQLIIENAASPGGGMQGVAVLTLRAYEGTVFQAKWRAHGTESRFNDPAAGLAADRFQELLLEPEDTVIPPTEPHCLSKDEHQRYLRVDRDPIEGTQCVLGYVSAWLTGAKSLRELRERGLVHGAPEANDPMLYRAERFARDARYRRNVAHLNLIAHLIAHGDAHAGQFVGYPDPLHLFLVDNSVAFGLDHRGAMQGRQDFFRMVVPAIPEDTARRLSRIRDSELEGLSVLAEFRRGGQTLRRVPPGAPVGDLDERLRIEGDRVQLGLTPSEIGELRSRIIRLRAELRRGNLGTFR